jgi:Domain of unknown function (DUF4386)
MEAEMRILGLGFIAFVIAANLAFVGLQASFGYDDILREPAGVILARFREGGTVLIGLWALFALSAAAFVPLALAMDKAAQRRWGAAMPIATAFGVVSGVLQAIGLARWVFAVPGIAELHLTEPAIAEALLWTLHQLAGVALGEFLGQLFLVGWTLGAARMFWACGDKWLQGLSVIGFATVPLWLLGFTELFATVAPGVPVVEAAPWAFMGWEAWLFAVGVRLATLRSHTVAP